VNYSFAVAVELNSKSNHNIKRVAEEGTSNAVEEKPAQRGLEHENCDQSHLVYRSAQSGGDWLGSKAVYFVKHRVDNLH
jgi:hypothetical protein